MCFPVDKILLQNYPCMFLEILLLFLMPRTPFLDVKFSAYTLIESQSIWYYIFFSLFLVSIYIEHIIKRDKNKLEYIKCWMSILLKLSDTFYLIQNINKLYYWEGDSIQQPYRYFKHRKAYLRYELCKVHSIMSPHFIMSYSIKTFSLQ